MNKEDFEKYIGQLTPGVKNLLRKMAIYLRETSQRVDPSSEITDKTSPDQPEEQKSAPSEPSSSDDQPKDQKSTPPEPSSSDDQPEGPQ